MGWRTPRTSSTARLSTGAMRREPTPRRSHPNLLISGRGQKLKVERSRLTFRLLTLISSVGLEAHFRTIIEMQELSGSWRPKVLFRMLWNDDRLEYQNLKDDDNLNILTEEERDEIWLPAGRPSARYQTSNSSD